MTFAAKVGHLYLVDKSALALVRVPAVVETLSALIDDGHVATCGTVDLEAGYPGRSADAVRGIREVRRKLYVNLPITESVAERAQRTELRVAARDQRRAAAVVDLLTAAIAEHRGAVILNHVADFEHIAAETGQQQMWMASRGSLG